MRSDVETLARDEKVSTTQRLKHLEERVDLLAKAVKIIMQRPVQHAISAEEAETLKEVIASL